MQDEPLPRSIQGAGRRARSLIAGAGAALGGGRGGRDRAARVKSRVGTERQDAARVQVQHAAIIAEPLILAKVDGLGDPGHLINLAGC